MAPFWSRRSWDWVKLPDLAEIGRSMERAARSIRDLDPGPQMQRLHADRDAANAQLRRIRELPPGTRRKTERLAAYCPRGCQVVAVYAVSGMLLLDLRSDVLITGETLFGDVPDGRSHPRGTRLPHRGHWVTDRMLDRRWMVDCHHAAYPVAGASLLALLPVTGRATVDVSALAPRAAC